MIQPNKTNRIGKYAGEKTLKKNPTLINARPKKTLGYKIPAFLFEKELQVLRFI